MQNAEYVCIVIWKNRIYSLNNEYPRIRQFYQTDSGICFLQFCREFLLVITITVIVAVIAILSGA